MFFDTTQKKVYDLVLIKSGAPWDILFSGVLQWTPRAGFYVQGVMASLIESIRVVDLSAQNSIGTSERKGSVHVV